MHNRIRLLRETKKLSRAAFGEKIGVSGDVINKRTYYKVNMYSIFSK